MKKRPQKAKVQTEPAGAAPGSVPLRRSRAANGRATFGFLLASLHTGASRVLWPGLLEAAEKHDVNLICFPGGRLQAADSFESQRNTVYDLAGEDCLDGLVTWSSSLGGVVGPAEIKSFHERYLQLPMVSLAGFMEGLPTVSVDGYQGMRALFSHLIEGHGYRRLAFIRGPEEHYYAQERYRAYLDSLRAFDLPYVPELVTRPLRWESGEEAVRILLDERGLAPGRDFDAVVAVSDLLALWALKTLQARGFQVPDDVAVTGFNNSIEERLANPPLTTVDIPFHDQGAKAVDVLMEQWSGNAVPALITLPSNLIVRQSCGCPSAAVERAAYRPEREIGSPNEFDVSAARSGFLQQAAEQPGLDPERAALWLGPVFDALHSDLTALDSGASSGRFLPALEGALNLAVREHREILAWQNLISILRTCLIPVAHAGVRVPFEAKVSQARVMIGEAAQRAQAFWEWQADRQADVLRETGRALLTTFDEQQLTEVLVERLPLLGIPSAYLALYENPSASLEYARLVLAFTERGRLPLEPGGLRFPVCQLIPAGLLPEDRRYSLVVEPLYFQDKSIGYVVFEKGPNDGDVYELLRGNLSSALQGAILFEEIQQARMAAEKADRIKTRLLANVSHEMRTPLNIILGYTQNALQTPNPYQHDVPSALMKDLRQIQSSAEHQLRVINDLLDLSRAEIDELDLALELIDPRPLLLEAFHDLADQAASPGVTWKLELPDRLPLIRADSLRLRQILLNLLSNARKFTDQGEIVLGVEVAPPHLHLRVADTGLGISIEQQERIFEPFVTLQDNRRLAGGIGLGLSITRHLVILHGGRMCLESRPGSGSTFHIDLPLPALEQARIGGQDAGQPAVLLISSEVHVPEEIASLCRRQGLELRSVRGDENLEAVFEGIRPVAIAWDLAHARPGDWGLVRHLRHYPHLSQAPFILYGGQTAAGSAEEPLPMGLTGFVVKSAGGGSLSDAIQALDPRQADGPILIVDDDPQVRADHQRLVESSLGAYPVRTASDGEGALEAMAGELPALVLLDLVMPGLSGADVLDRMRADPRLRQVPVIILSNKVMNLEDVRRLEHHARVTLQSKGIWSEMEAISALHRALFGTDALPVQTSGLVKQAVAYLHQNYGRGLSRWEIADAVGVSEDYLSRVFNRELGLTPWEYLNRYRVLHAKTLLWNTADNIGSIARQVGFNDQAYFSRVFHKLTGMSPFAFRGSRAGQD